MSKTASALLLSFFLSAQGANANELCPKVSLPSIHIQYTEEGPSVRVLSGLGLLDERGVSEALKRIESPYAPTPSGNYPIGCEDSSHRAALRKIQSYKENHGIPLDVPRLDL